MSKRFFRSDFGKKTAAMTDDELRDKLLVEDMARLLKKAPRHASHEAEESDEGKHTAKNQSAPRPEFDAPTLLSKKTAAMLKDFDIDTKRIREEVSEEADAATRHEQACAADIASLINPNPPTAPVRPEALSEEDSGSCGDSVQAGICARPHDIYSDPDVCRLLGIRRRVLVKARTARNRGSAWDCRSFHVGMTEDWIMSRLLEKGASVVDIGSIKPIADDDGIVSCRVVGSWPNYQRVTVEVIATGEREVAMVKDSRLLHLNDGFDCRRFGGVLSWTHEANDCEY